MTGDAFPINCKTFVRTLVASRLLDEFQLAEILLEYRALLREAHSAESLPSFSDYLLERGTISPWQCEKLRKGKHKGFIVDQFVLMEPLRKTHNVSVYRARHVRTEEQKLLEVDWFSSTETFTKFTILDR